MIFLADFMDTAQRLLLIAAVIAAVLTVIFLVVFLLFMLLDMLNNASLTDRDRLLWGIGSIIFPPLAIWYYFKSSVRRHPV